MDAEYLPFNNSSDRQEIKGVVEIVPNIVVAILFTNFVVKAIHVGYVSRLMIASQKHDGVRVL